MWEFGAGLRFSWVMGGLARTFGPDDHGRLVLGWLDAAAETGMPLDPRIWRRAPISSTYPACQAVKAAAEQGEHAAYAYLRRVREALMLEGRKLDHAEALVAEAATAGLDVERFRIDLDSHAITEAFGADLDEVRDVPAQARAAGAVAEGERTERVALPSAVFVGEDGSRHGVWGRRPFRDHREAAIAAGAESLNAGGLEPLDAIERFGRCATRELEELSGRPRPLVEAELWTAAREWRVRPIEALTGMLWEPAR
jgi:protein-disulfide isomerase-like protein with CxxC motif